MLQPQQILALLGNISNCAFYKLHAQSTHNSSEICPIFESLKTR